MAGGGGAAGAIANAVASLTNSILGFISQKKERDFQKAMYNEEANVQAYASLIMRWYDRACEHKTTVEQIALNENSLYSDEIRYDGGIEKWFSINRERERASWLYNSYFPNRSFYKKQCESFFTIDNIKIYGGILLVIIIIYLISSSKK